MASARPSATRPGHEPAPSARAPHADAGQRGDRGRQRAHVVGVEDALLAARRRRRARSPRRRRAPGRRGAVGPRRAAGQPQAGDERDAASGSSQAIWPPTCALNIRHRPGGAAERRPPPPTAAALAEDPAEAVVAEDQVPDRAVGAAADVRLRARPERHGERPRGADGDHRDAGESSWRTRASSRGGPASRYAAPSAGTTIQPCSIFVMNARPTTAPHQARYSSRPDSIARTVQAGGATSSRTSSASGLLTRADRDRHRRERERRRRRASPAAGPNTRRTVAYSSADGGDRAERLRQQDR